MNTSIYQNIATRTAGDIYIGVVGPVRTGKSTFIKRFMETQVIPKFSQQPAPVGYAVHIEVVGVSITRAGKSDYPHGQSAKRPLHSL